MKVNAKQGDEKQNPESWADKNASRTPYVIIKGMVQLELCKDLHQEVLDKTDRPPMMVVQNQDNDTMIFANRVQKLIRAPIFSISER